MRLSDRFFHMAGLAARARKCVFGALACEKAIKNSSAFLVLIDGATAEATKKSFLELCRSYGVEVLIVEPAGELGKKTGKPAGKLFAITDKNFANQLVCIYKEES